MPVTDRRVLRSRVALERALLGLAAERDLAQISISDVTKRAEVNRSTFYEHYLDVHDLAESACTALFDELIAATPVLRPGTAEEAEGSGALTEVFAHVGEHARLYRALVGPDGSARVIDHLHHRIAIAVHANVTGTGPGGHADDPADIPHDPAAAFLAGALVGTILAWLRHGCPGTPEEAGAAIWPQLRAAAPPAYSG